MTGYAGQKETARLAARHREMLLARFPLSLVDAAANMAQNYEPPEACLPETRVRIGAGGVTAALWILGEKLQSGLTADLLSIPIRQETVEICELFDLDPYELSGDGAWLIAVADAEEAVWHCSSKGIPASRIGTTTPGEARVLSCGEITRYLERA